MSKFEESNFYKALQDFFINADKKTFLQFLAEFYNRTEGIIDKNNIQDDLIKELRELYLEFNEKGINENILREKIDYFLENNREIKNIYSRIDNNYSKIKNVDLQLDKTVKSMMGNIKLNIPCYDGGNQAVHPKVLYFNNGWNGYKYWMIFTPYTKTNDKYENPSIVCSDDGVEWIVPNGLINPISPKPSNNETWYNSDPHLVMNGNTMEVWYRKAEKNPKNEWIYRQTSTDGINWTQPELLMTGIEGNDLNLLSPVVMYEEGKYRIWVATNGKLRYFESTTGSNWQLKNTNLMTGYPYLWHHDIIKDGDKYILLYCGGGGADNGYRKSLYYAIGSDGLTWSEPIELMSYKNNTGFDCFEMYRSTIAVIDNDYRIWYSACGKNDNGNFNGNKNWGTSMVVLPKKDFSKIIPFTQLSQYNNFIDFKRKMCNTSYNGTTTQKFYYSNDVIQDNGTYYFEYKNQSDNTVHSVILCTPWKTEIESRTGDVTLKSKNKQLSFSGTDKALVPSVDGELSIGKYNKHFDKGYINQLHLKDILELGVFTNRPASGGFVGAVIYDDTLKKPIYWDGSKWCDMMGNAV